MGRTQQDMHAAGVTSAHVTVSHDRDYATAFVVLERDHFHAAGGHGDSSGGGGGGGGGGVGGGGDQQKHERSPPEA